MEPKSVLRDSRLIDSLEVLPHAPFKATVWRVVREARDPCQCSASGGRWDDGSFDVLYTSLDRDGAIAEMYFQLLRGQPVFPSKVRYTLNELRVELSETLHLQTLPDLAALGLDTSRYGQLSSVERIQEYTRTQEIAEVAHFLDCDGLVSRVQDGLAPTSFSSAIAWVRMPSRSSRTMVLSTGRAGRRRTKSSSKA